MGRPQALGKHLHGAADVYMRETVCLWSILEIADELRQTRS